VSVTSEHTLRIRSNEANGTWNIGITGSAAESARVDANYVSCYHAIVVVIVYSFVCFIVFLVSGYCCVCWL
jgi:predicted secreted protein